MSHRLCALCAFLALGLAACSSDSSGSNNSATLSACLERPDELPRPPTGTLSCGLIPPGLSLE